MIAANLLLDCERQGIRITASGPDRLEVDAPRHLLTDSFLGKLRQNKRDLLALLLPRTSDPCCAVPARGQLGRLSLALAVFPSRELLTFSSEQFRTVREWLCHCFSIHATHRSFLQVGKNPQFQHPANLVE